MDIDEEKIDEAVLALLYPTRHLGFRAWKGHLGCDGSASTRRA
jgi:hypothetical protein